MKRRSFLVTLFLGGCATAIAPTPGVVEVAETNTCPALETGNEFQIYSEGAKWRWRLMSSNGRNIANGGQGYSSKQACRDAIERVKASFGAQVRSV